MFLNAQGVEMFQSLVDLTGFMTSDVIWLDRTQILLWNVHGWRDGMAMNSLNWMMAKYAFAWEVAGWQFEPLETPILVYF